MSNPKLPLHGQLVMQNLSFFYAAFGKGLILSNRSDLTFSSFVCNLLYSSFSNYGIIGFAFAYKVKILMILTYP